MRKDLQQFVRVLNWMRLSIPGYNVQVRPLVELLEQVCKVAGGAHKGQGGQSDAGRRGMDEGA
jgi:hypothetical protein